MKKIVEIEYVGIEDVQEIVEDVFEILRNTKHYISVVMEEVCGNTMLKCYIMLDGFDADKNFDYSYSFKLSDDERDVSEMNGCKNVLKNLLAEG